ncbi:MAG: TIGR04013 family B12-binding domain/radical SAM domain-containing protein [Methanomicrobiaceae archaeon]|nr:TIGR04013 family B12-binding domain/radical SAM domain-containing protein [Methanomicrobiaceae archaeon]
MQVNWRTIKGTNNSYAALYAACELYGIHLEAVDRPAAEITCYSLNSIIEPHFRDEIRDADCITVVGGPHATACPGEVCTYADYAVIGEGERTLPLLLERLRDGTTAPPPGVATAHTVRPADSCVRLDAFAPFSKVRGYIEISRGCPYGCTYCQTPRMFGRSMRHRSIDAVARAASCYRDARFISPNAFAYGSDGIHPRFEKLERLLRALDNAVYLATFPSEVRPEFVTPESLDLVCRYCANRKVHFGAQSGSDGVLAAIRRGHSVADVIRAVELCREFDLVPVVDVIVGFPCETEEDQRATLELVEWVARYGQVHAHHFTPLPGTPLAGQPPGPILPETQKTLGRLALKGKATGSWIAPEARFFKKN